VIYKTKIKRYNLYMEGYSHEIRGKLPVKDKTMELMARSSYDRLSHRQLTEKEEKHAHEMQRFLTSALRSRDKKAAGMWDAIEMWEESLEKPGKIQLFGLSIKGEQFKEEELILSKEINFPETPDIFLRQLESFLKFGNIKAKYIQGSSIVEDKNAREQSMVQKETDISNEGTDTTMMQNRVLPRRVARAIFTQRPSQNP
jgi:hypothetical protein